MPTKRSIRPDLIRYVVCHRNGGREYHPNTSALGARYQVTNEVIRRWVRSRALGPNNEAIIEVSAYQRTFHWFDSLPYGDLADVVTDLAPATVRRRALAERIPAVVRLAWAPKVGK